MSGHNQKWAPAVYETTLELHEHRGGRRGLLIHDSFRKEGRRWR
jgi:hypothetical protein